MKESLKKIISNPLFSGSLIMILGSNSINVLNYIYHLLMGRLLGPVGYGELATLISIIGLLGTVPGSLSLVIIKYISSVKNDQELSNLVDWLRSKVLNGSILLFILILIISPAVSTFLHINNIVYIILIAVSFLFSLSSMLNRSILQGLLKFRENVSSILVENTSKLVISIFLVYIGLNVGGAILAITIAVIIGWYITNTYLKFKNINNAKILPDIKPMIVFTVPVLVQTIAITSLYSTDLVLVKHFFSPYEVGIYAAISTLGKIIFFGAGPISAVMFPLISKRHSLGEKYNKIFIYSILSTAFIAITVTTIYWFRPDLAISILYGRAYLEAASLLVWSAIFMTFFTLSSVVISFCLSMGRTKVVFLPTIAAIAQIIGIWLFHNSLINVLEVSILITSLLLFCLLIYSSYKERIK